MSIPKKEKCMTEMLARPIIQKPSSVKKSKVGFTRASEQMQQKKQVASSTILQNFGDEISRIVHPQNVPKKPDSSSSNATYKATYCTGGNKAKSAEKNKWLNKKYKRFDYAPNEPIQVKTRAAPFAPKKETKLVNGQMPIRGQLSMN